MIRKFIAAPSGSGDNDKNARKRFVAEKMPFLNRFLARIVLSVNTHWRLEDVYDDLLTMISLEKKKLTAEKKDVPPSELEAALEYCVSGDTCYEVRCYSVASVLDPVE